MTREEKCGEQSGGGETEASLTWRAVASIIYVIASNFIAGYCMTVLNSPGNLIMEFMNETSLSRGEGEMPLKTQTSLYGLLSAIFAIGALVSSVLTQKMADYVGRRRLLALCAVCSMVSALMMGLSKVASSYELLFVGRALSGLTSGVQVATQPFYLAELVPRRYIGPVMVLNIMIFMIAGLAVSIVGYDDLFSTYTLWPVIVGSQGVFALLQLCLFVVAVPSPFFLLNKQREEEAIKALQLLRGQRNVEQEIREMKESAQSRHKEQEMSVIQLFRTPSLRRRLVVNTLAMVCMMWTGIIIVIFYSVQVIMAVGFSQRVARYLSSGVTCVGILSTSVALYFVQRLPRRRMQLWGLAGMFFFESVLSIALIFGENIFWLKVVALICIPGIAGSQAFGPAQVPWLLIPELFDDSSRGSASSVCGMVLWLSLFVIGYAFPPMQAAIGPYCALPFVGLSAFFFVFFFIFQPETLGQTTKEQTIIVDESSVKGDKEAKRPATIQ